MYLSFENSNRKGVVIDQTTNNNDAKLLKGATISQHPLGNTIISKYTNPEIFCEKSVFFSFHSPKPTS